MSKPYTLHNIWIWQIRNITLQFINLWTSYFNSWILKPYLTAEWLIILNSKAHLIWPKSAQKGAQYLFPKKSHIFGKRRTIFDPPNNFYCIFIHEFFGDAKFKKKNLKFFIFSGFFSIFFLLKAFFTILQRRTKIFQGATWLWK